MKPAPQLDLTKAKDAAEQTENAIDTSTLLAGLVVSVARDRVLIWPNGTQDEITLMRTPDGPQPAVGDTAFWQAGRDGPLRLMALDGRRTVLSRPDPQNPNRALILAANVDLAIVVVSARSPGFRPNLIDRCLIAIWHGGAKPVICLNKIDLISNAERDEMAQRLAAFEGAGVEVLMTSTQSSEGLASLRERMSKNTCVLIGHSGVGKSSLLNAIDPNRERRTASGREFDGKGRHTTTSSQLVELDDGTRLIDTPGVRAFGLWEIPPSELLGYFPDLAAFQGGCRFGNCSHLNEPDCAVQAAVANGQIHSARYDAYQRIYASLHT